MSDVKVGDIVTAYEKGYWRVDEIVPRFYSEWYFRHSSYQEVEPGVYQNKYEPFDILRIGDPYSSLVKLTKVANVNFTPSGKHKSECDISYCMPLDESEIDAIRSAYLDNLESLRRLLPEHRLYNRIQCPACYGSGNGKAYIADFRGVPTVHSDGWEDCEECEGRGIKVVRS